MPFEVPDVTVYAGDTLVFPTYTIEEGEDGGPWTPVNLTAWDLEAQWRPTPTAESEITLSVDVTSASEGTVGISATPTQTRQMDRAGVWDLQGVRGAEVRTFLRGKTVYVEDVTRNG